MKNKLLITLFAVVFLILIFTLPTYAAEANVILERDHNLPNKVKVFVEVSKEQSFTATNVVLDVNSSNKVNIATPEFSWSSEITNNNEVAKWTYNNDKVNLYVISKNELGNESANGRKLLEIGTLTLNTKNQEETTIDISVPQDGLKIASLDHRIATLTNTDIAKSTQLVLNKKEETKPDGDNNNQGDNNEPGDNTNINPPAGGDTNNPSTGTNNNQGTGTNNQGNNSNKKPGSNTNRKPNAGTNNNNQLENNIENNVTNEIENQIVENNISNNENKNTNKVQTNTQSSRDLPDTGEEENKSKFPYIIGCIVLVLIAIFAIYIINKPKRKKKRNYYK